MPLSPDEQRILDEIEQRLAQEDPRLVEAVSRTSLYTHLARRIKWSLLAFLGGFILLLVFLMVVPDLLWVAALAFGVMLASALLIYRYLKQLTLDQMRAMQQQSGRFSLTGLLARLAGRFRNPPPSSPGP
jgi:Flp pilus assembly protein TadB